jgi:hypothetical protein
VNRTALPCNHTLKCHYAKCSDGHFWGDTYLPCNNLVVDRQCSSLFPQPSSVKGDTYISLLIRIVGTILITTAVVVPILGSIYWVKDWISSPIPSPSSVSVPYRAI